MELIDLVIITGIIIIIIILFIYICNIDNNIIEYFEDEYIFKDFKLGPIKFIDSITREEMGKYPNNWDENEIRKKGLIETIIKIPKGEIGPGGERGPKGVVGPRGVRGPVGNCEKGATGGVGPKGPRGPDGEAGTCIKGPVGGPGPEGPRGLPGPQGELGPEAPAGLPGPRGVIGPDGPGGVKGDDGPIGPQGITGPQGAPGPRVTCPSGPPGNNAVCSGNIVLNSINMDNTDGKLLIGGRRLIIDAKKVIFKDKICFDTLDSLNNDSNCITISDLVKIRSLREA